MTPDKNLMNINGHLSDDYEKGVEIFLDYAFTILGI